MYEGSKGFTLIELIIVIAILGIITAIVAPKFSGCKSLSEERACDANRNMVKRLYSAYILENEHNDSIVFNLFLIENINFDLVCPAGGIITYEGGKIQCSIHEDVSNDGADDSDEVPWL